MSEPAAESKVIEGAGAVDERSESALAVKAIDGIEHPPLETMRAAFLVKATVRESLSPLEPTRGEGDAEIIRLAGRQRGLVHRRQLLAAGLSQHQITWRLGHLQLTKVCHSVYAPGAARPSGPLVDETVAAMRFDGIGVLSHLTAARLWEIADLEPERVQMTLVGVKHRTAPDGVILTTVDAMDPSEMRRRRGLPVTSPARTWVDMAGICSVEECESALAIIRGRKLCRDQQIRDVIARAPANKAGIKLARELLDDPDPGGESRSTRERKLLALLAEAGIPKPLTNVPVQGNSVDFFWPEYGFVVEFDSWQFHQSRAAFENDRRRDQELTAAGIMVQRITARQMDRRPVALVARLAEAITRCAIARRAVEQIAA